MTTIAEKLAAKPTKALQEIADGVQDVANASQSFAYRFEDQDDGSRIEIRCAAEPALTALPGGDPNAEGLVVHDGRLLRVIPHRDIEAARAELADQVAACEQAMAGGDPDVELDAARYLERAQLAQQKLEAAIAAGVQNDTHVAIPADEKTTAWHDELGPGGRTFIAHPAG